MGISRGNSHEISRRIFHGKSHRTSHGNSHWISHGLSHGTSHGPGRAWAGPGPAPRPGPGLSQGLGQARLNNNLKKQILIYCVHRLHKELYLFHHRRWCINFIRDVAWTSCCQCVANLSVPNKYTCPSIKKQTRDIKRDLYNGLISAEPPALIGEGEYRRVVKLESNTWIFI